MLFDPAQLLLNTLDYINSYFTSALFEQQDRH